MPRLLRLLLGEGEAVVGDGRVVQVEAVLGPRKVREERMILPDITTLLL